MDEAGPGGARRGGLDPGRGVEGEEGRGKRAPLNPGAAGPWEQRRARPRMTGAAVGQRATLSMTRECEGGEGAQCGAEILRMEGAQLAADRPWPS